MNDILILSDDKGSLLPIKLQKIDIFNIYRKKVSNKIIRIVRKLHLKSCIPFKKIWFDDWTRIICKYNKIIIFSTGNGDSIVNFVKKYNKNAKIIFWYWGPVNISINPFKINQKKVEKWTFDKDDSINYNLKLNTQFYCFENINRISKNCNINKSDVFFVGTSKNRLNEIIEIEKKFKFQNISCYFHIVKSTSYYQNNIDYKFKNQIPYGDALFAILNTKAILDINSPEQVGLSLHPMEALFFKKKLITNNKNIKNEKLYNPNNIFILGEDNENNIYNFINSKYDENDYDKLRNYYSIYSWANRFFEGEQ